MDTVRYNIYELLNGTDCYGGLQPATYTEDGTQSTPSVNPVIQGQAGFEGDQASACCMTPGTLYAIQIDGGSSGDEGQYIIEYIQEVESDAGMPEITLANGELIQFTDLDTSFVCFGDSFTFGDELSNRDNAWPGVLNQMTNHNVVGIAKPGASNSWMCNMVIEKCLEHKPQLVIIAWTTPNRYDFFDERNNSVCININDSTDNPFVKQLYSKYHNSGGKFLEWVCQAILLQNFLEKDYRYYH